MSAELATVSFRTESGMAEGESWTVVDSAMLSNTVPWRTFRADANPWVSPSRGTIMIRRCAPST